MKSMLAPGDQLFADTFCGGAGFGRKTVPRSGSRAKTVTLIHARGIHGLVYASEKDLTELASTVLNASMPAGFTTRTGTAVLRAAQRHLTDNRGVTRWSLRVSRQLEEQVDRSTIIPLVQGRSLAERNSYPAEGNLDPPSRQKSSSNPPGGRGCR
jgi:hypothetical protein